MASYHFKFAFAVVFLVFAGSAFCDNPVPERWQNGPLTCFSCNTVESCMTPKKDDVKKCAAKKDLCVTIFEDKQIQKRGCLKDLADDCTDDEKCHKCASNYCNKAETKDDYINCISCDSAEEKTCVTKVADIAQKRKCYKQCMVALYPKENDVNGLGYELVRSCLDDKEKEDQEECNSEDSYCKKCDKNDCNQFPLPENRLQCYQCEGNACKTSQLTQCPTYKKDDFCVFIFNNDKEFDKADCKSSLSKENVKKLEKEGKLYQCPENGCNAFNNLPKIPQCFKCDSSSVPNCATNPEKLSTELADCDFNYCFTQILNNGDTKRGCFTNLVDDIKKNSKMDSEKSFAQCKQDKCNNKIYPSERVQCYKCNPTEAKDCAANLENSGACLKYDKNNKDACVTKFNKETKQTIRGCRSEHSCADSADSKKCQVCDNENLCNTVNLKEKNGEDPKPGKWQKVPLKCFKCNSQEDCKTNLVKEECKTNTDQCVTVFNNKGKVVKRDCATSTKEECSKEENDCFKCVSNECNVANEKSEYISCLSCDTKSDPKCVTDVKSIKKSRDCYKSCMVALYEKEDDPESSFELVRSCLDDKDKDDQEKCNGNDCKQCDKDDCNKFPLPENRLQCYQCEGNACKNSQLSQCPTYKKDDFCVFIFNNDKKFDKADCKSSLSKENVKKLEKEGKLYQCPENGCNAFNNLPKIPQCFKCDSSSVPNCATNPEKLSTELADCDFNYCFTQILNNGDTKRGCFTNLVDDIKKNSKMDSEKSFAQCKQDKCNNKIYPSERVQCYKCNPTEAKDCAANLENSGACLKYDKNNKDACVTKFNKETKQTIRGCRSEHSCADSADSKKCQVCDNENLCNTVNLKEKNGEDPKPGKWQKLPLKCFKCNSQEDCKTNLVKEECKTNTDQCVTVFNNKGKVVKRDCATSTKEECSKEENDCFKCVSNECNVANEKSEYISCLSCDTKSDPKCVTDVKSIMKSRDCYKSCMVALYEKEDDPESSFELVRSCLDDKDKDDQEKCNGNDCKQCDKDDCNNFPLPENRLKCYQCEGDACKDSQSTDCPTYKEKDICVYTFEKNNVFSKAHCKSFFSKSVIETLEREGKLFSCKGNSCNSFDKKPKSPSCFVCDSNSNENCATNPEKLTTPKQCDYNYCFTQILDGVTKRGCFSSLDSTLQGSCTEASTEHCTQCKEKDCNDKIYPANRRKCQRCNSKNDGNCETNPNIIGACPKYAADDSCVTHFDKENNTTKRGCSSEYPCDETDDKKCRVCKGTDSCNTVDLKKENGAMGIYLTVGTVLAMLCHLVL